MKRMLLTVFLAGLAAAALASPNDDQYLTSDQSASSGSTGAKLESNPQDSPWAQDHNFIAPAP